MKPVPWYMTVEYRHGDCKTFRSFREVNRLNYKDLSLKTPSLIVHHLRTITLFNCALNTPWPLYNNNYLLISSLKESKREIKTTWLLLIRINCFVLQLQSCYILWIFIYLVFQVLNFQVFYKNIFFK